MAEVFVCKTGQLSTRSKSDLRKAGIVVVEVDDPASCQFTRSSEAIGADDMLWACLAALNHQPKGYGDDGKAQRELLARNLFNIVTDARAQRKGAVQA